MKKLLISFVVLFALVFAYTTIAQELSSLRKQYKISFTEKIQNPLGPPLAAGTYTVGTGGYFPTIDSAFKKLSLDGIAGAVNLTLIDTLYQTPIGRRFELVGPVTGAGPNARITIRPDVNTKVKIRGDSTAVLTFTDVKYVTVDGHSNPSSSAEIMVHALYNPASDWNDCIDVWRDADYNHFLNLTLKSDDIRSLGTCLAIINDGANRPDSNLVEGNSTSGTIGMYVVGSTATNTRPRGNIIRGNIIGSATCLFGAWGIASEYATGTIIEGNTVQFLRIAMYPDYIIGIEAFVNSNTVIRNNIIHSLFGSSGAIVEGIAVTGTSSYPGTGLQIYNNVIYDLNNTSTSGNGYICGIDTWRNNTALIAYNSVQISGTGTNPLGTYALGVDVGSTNFTIRNNIFVNAYNQTAGRSSFALWVAAGNTFTSDYNDLYVNSTLSNSYIGYFGSNYRTLSSWQNIGKDLHSYSELPEFIAPDDLHINTLIPTYLESGGTPVTGIYFDFDGDVRNLLTPDIGADEFDGIIKPPPTLVLTPEVIDFGIISIGQISDTVSVTVKNQSTQSVTINSISNSQSAFNLLDVPVLPLSLSANDSIVFNVFFNPTTYGVSNDIVVISNSDTINPNASLFLTGNVLLLGPQFQAFYDEVNNATSYAQKEAIVQAFLNNHPILPFIEDTIAHFIYHGSANKLTIPCDANGWNTNAWPMLKFSGIDLWFKPQTFEMDARIDYKFYLNESQWIFDPRNPLRVPSDYGENSELAMPDYIHPPEVNYYPDILHGSRFDTTFYSSQLNNTRPIRIYLPPGYDPSSTESYPVTLIHDGGSWWNVGKANNILDYLIDKKRIKPLIGVFVPPVNRDDEYAFNKTTEFETFIISELMPYIDSRFRTKTEPSQRAMTGGSYGGLITTQICYNHPEIFGLAAPFSAAYEPKNKEVFNSVVNGPQKDIRWYIEWGTYESEMLLDVPMKDALVNKGYDIIWRQWHEGHTLSNWRAHLDIALEYFFPGDSAGTGVENEYEIPTSYSLSQNFPNPFNPNTTIRYQIPIRSIVTLKLYDILGREIITLVNEEKAAGNYDIDFNASAIASGVYFYRLEAGDYTSVKKMILLK